MLSLKNKDVYTKKEDGLETIINEIKTILAEQLGHPETAVIQFNDAFYNFLNSCNDLKLVKTVNSLGNDWFEIYCNGKKYDLFQNMKGLEYIDKRYEEQPVDIISHKKAKKIIDSLREFAKNKYPEVYLENDNKDFYAFELYKLLPSD